MDNRSNWLAVACVRKAHGLQGFCKISSYSGDYSHIKKAKEVKVVCKTATEFYNIEAITKLGDGYILKFEGINSPEEVKQLNGADIYLKREELIPCKEGEFYRGDLVGCELIFDGKVQGKVNAIIEGAASDLLEVNLFDEDSSQDKKKTVLIPFIKNAIGEVDVKQGKIELLEEWYLL